MKTTTTHHLYLRRLRTLGIAVALALLAVSGTTAMIGWLSGSGAAQRGMAPAGFSSITPLAPVQSGAQALAADTLLYERVVGTDGQARWVLADEAQAQAFAPATRDTLATVGAAVAVSAPEISNVSYTLQAKPAGWNKLLKSCDRLGAATASGAAAYDLTCGAKLG